MPDASKMVKNEYFENALIVNPTYVFLYGWTWYEVIVEAI